MFSCIYNKAALGVNRERGTSGMRWFSLLVKECSWAGSSYTLHTPASSLTFTRIHARLQKEKGRGAGANVIAHTGTSPQSNSPRFAHFQSSDSEGKYWLCGSA